MGTSGLGEGHIIVAGPAGAQGCGESYMVYCGLCREYFYTKRNGDKGREPCPYAREFGDCFACHAKGTRGKAVPMGLVAAGRGFLCDDCLNTVETALVVLGRVRRKEAQ